jgi:hypothetical protein
VHHTAKSKTFKINNTTMIKTMSKAYLYTCPLQFILSKWEVFIGSILTNGSMFQRSENYKILYSYGPVKVFVFHRKQKVTLFFEKSDEKLAS